MSAPAASVPPTTPAPAAPTAGAAPAANLAANYASASLYVGDLNQEVTEAILFEQFNAVGPVASVRVCRDAATRRSLGYAYVNFHRLEDADRALETMNFKPIRGRPCRIMWSHRDPSLRKSGLGNIFVNHLAKSIDHKTLYDTFSVFGSILSCKVAMNAKRESLGYGFVHYESEEAAKAAIDKVDGKLIANQQVQVSFFKSKKERGGANKFKFTNVFVKNLPGDVSKDDLDKLFAKYGNITSSMITQSKEDKTKAFGFINFATPEEAVAAVDALHNVDFQGKKLYVSRAQKKEEREKELREKFELSKMERAKKWQGVNLYIKNLSDETDDEKLSSEFSKFGSISSAKIMRDSVGKSRGFGFVCYIISEEATKAVTEMNGRMLDNKPLYVALAQRKEVRRAHLEAQYAARQKMNVPVPGVGVPMPGLGGVAPGVMAPGMPYPQGPLGAFPQGLPPHARQFIYPGQMGQMGRYPANAAAAAAAAAQMMMRPGAQVPYQLMPVNNRGPMNGNQVVAGVPPGVAGVPGVNQGRQQRSNRPRGQPGNVKPQTGFPAGQQAQNMRYGNRQAAAGENIMPSVNEPLTIQTLASAPADMRKQMIGERLFPLVKNEQPQYAGKITGMLLEMDDTELIHLLEAPAALQEKIGEAMQVLKQHPESESGETQN